MASSGETVHRDAVLFQPAYDADVRQPDRGAAGQHEANLRPLRGLAVQLGLSGAASGEHDQEDDGIDGLTRQ